MPDNDTTEDDLERGLALHRAGDHAGAALAYEAVLTRQPANAEALQFLGLIRHAAGDHRSAVELITRAIAINPAAAPFHFNLGLILLAAGQDKEAEAAFRVAARLDPGNPDIASSLAAALKAAGQTDAAMAALEDALRRNPDHFGVAYNFGNLKLAVGAAAEAVDIFTRILSIETASDRRRAARLNLAVALQALGRAGEAEPILQSLLAEAPEDAAVLNNLGNALRQLNRPEEAASALRRAAAIDPDLADARYNLGAVLADLNDIDGAHSEFRAAARLQPGHIKAEWQEALALPQIYSSADHAARCRAGYLAGLERIAARVATAPASEAPVLLAAVTEITPFALAYQGENDLQPMHRFGDMIASIVARNFPRYAELRSAATGQRKRLGFVSAHFRAHTVAHLFQGWVLGLDPQRFEVHLISTSGPGDHVTAALAGKVSAAHLAPATPSELVQRIAVLGLDAIVYPDVGMDPKTQLLAALPLAPVQFAGWGHPVTTGLPTINSFLSSVDMEPEDAEAHYREKLVRLPGLSINYEPPDIGLPQWSANSAPVIFCAQSLFKVPPRQDAVFAQILTQCPSAKLMFISHPIRAVTEAFWNRLAGALKLAGLDPETRLEFLRPTGRDEFIRRLHAADIILDTFDWSGGNTSLEALCAGTPIVSLPGRFMRGRHSMAMLSRIGTPELIAKDAADYAAVAVRLLTDPAFARDTRARIAQGRAKLFRDDAPVRALADVIDTLS
ncbi:MAG: tetratricopeptide repeat protein [Proteobacteria bacterium]|nr:tetratricopeptide repeat protein [Pseudomonadota bacterium]